MDPEQRLPIVSFKAYNMVLCGSADLAPLTYGKTSLFNISKVIYLRDFTYPEISQWLIPISRRLDVESDDSKDPEVENWIKTYTI